MKIEDIDQNRRLRDNLVAFKEDLAGMAAPDCGDEISLGRSNLAEVDRLLDTIDQPSEASGRMKKPMPVQMMAIIAKGIAKNKLDREENWGPMLEAFREASRRRSRKIYAAMCAAEGRAVRTYTKHPRLPDETDEERKRRLHREGTRRRRGKTAKTTRSYVRLDIMTESERRDRKRLQDAASKRATRAARRSQALTSKQGCSR